MFICTSQEFSNFLVWNREHISGFKKSEKEKKASFEKRKDLSGNNQTEKRPRPKTMQLFVFGGFVVVVVVVGSWRIETLVAYD